MESFTWTLRTKNCELNEHPSSTECRSTSMRPWSCQLLIDELDGLRWRNSCPWVLECCLNILSHQTRKTTKRHSNTHQTMHFWSTEFAVGMPCRDWLKRIPLEKRSMKNGLNDTKHVNISFCFLESLKRPISFRWRRSLKRRSRHRPTSGSAVPRVLFLRTRQLLHPQSTRSLVRSSSTSKHTENNCLYSYLFTYSPSYGYSTWSCTIQECKGFCSRICSDDSISKMLHKSNSIPFLSRSYPAQSCSEIFTIPPEVISSSFETDV